MSNAPPIASIFRHFLATGELGPIRCCMAKADVERPLGKAEPIENYTQDESVWCYWPAEIRFRGDLISGFGLGFEWWNGVLCVLLP